MKTILVPIDFSPVSRRVLDEAVVLATAVGARIVLQHVVKPPPIATDLAPVVGDIVKLTEELEQHARRHLRRLAQGLAKRGLTVEIVCQQGYPAAFVLAAAEQVGADYIVLGSHGHTAFYDLVLGGTASGVLRHAPCPIVVVPAMPERKPRAKKRSWFKRPVVRSTKRRARST